MKNVTTFILALFSVLAFGQAEKGKETVIDQVQTDDVYIAGEKITVNAAIKGDLVMAGASMIVKDSIHGDLTGAGGELFIYGYIMDDVRAAGGRITIDSEIGDDVVVAGGEVVLTENARINGKLVCMAGDLTINGEVMEELDVRGGDVSINGTVRGTSKVVAEDLTIGATAKFYEDVEYYNSDGETDFYTSLVDAKAHYSEDLGEEQSDLSLTTLGTKSLKMWIFYVLSSFLVILVLHALFKNAFSTATEFLENKLLKSFGFGLIYLFGIPMLILLAFLMLIGIPLGLFATAIFVFSLFFGHLVAAILVAYYWNNRTNRDWSFWSITFLALFIAIILRIFTMIPYAGILLSVVVLSISYGALSLHLLTSKKLLAKT